MKICVTIINTLLLLLVACAGPSDNKKNAGKDYRDLELSADIGERRIFYRFPAPNDIINYIKTERLIYNRELLNPSANTSKYLDSKVQQINLGTYSADFAYITVFNTLTEASEYFQSIEKLSYQVGLSSVFNETLKNRVEANEANIDSLSNIARESYINMVNQLTATGNDKQLSIISAGGYIEVLFLTVSQPIDIKNDLDLVRKIYDQRYGLENLINFINDFTNDIWVKELQKDLISILEILNLAEQKVVSESTKIEDSGSSFKFSGGKVEVAVAADNFNLLKNRVTEVRKKYTNPFAIN